MRQQLAAQHVLARDLKEQVEQQVARIQEAEQHQKVLLEAVALHSTATSVRPGSSARLPWNLGYVTNKY